MILVSKYIIHSDSMISIIVPVFQAEKFLRQCVDSIINQTYKNIEIILIDDGSTDDSGKICDLYAKKDSRIKVVHKKNGGLSESRNYGIKIASGTYISFIDSDDWIESDMYEVLINLAKKNNADIVSCGVYYEYPKKTIIHRIIDEDFNNNKDLCKALINEQINNAVWNKLYHKNCFSDIEFPCGHEYEDTATMYLLFLKATSAVSISTPLYHYRMYRKGSISSKHSMSNLIDFWKAHKSRLVYFLRDNRFNTDKELIDKLYYFYAYAVGRTWEWYFVCTEKEKKQYSSDLNEMYNFCVQNFPVFGKNGWPLRLRFSLFLGRFNNVFAFSLLHCIFRSCKYIRNIINTFIC